jgi:hypothetical protein
VSVAILEEGTNKPSNNVGHYVQTAGHFEEFGVMPPRAADTPPVPSRAPAGRSLRPFLLASGTRRVGSIYLQPEKQPVASRMKTSLLSIRMLLHVHGNCASPTLPAAGIEEPTVAVPVTTCIIVV